ncbi:MAG: Uma2 family endonuclease [Elainellaceae cyanobacterium]
MVQSISTPMTFDDFLEWDDGTERSFELIDGVPVAITDPNATHEDVADGLCALLTEHCRALNLSYVPKRSKQLKIETEPGEREKSRRADIIVFDRTEWLRLRDSSSPEVAYDAPPMVIEVVSTNWRDDYLTKLGKYEAKGIKEYWIVDYAGYGGVRYIGSPKQSTVMVYQLGGNEYLPGRAFQAGD